MKRSCRAVSAGRNCVPAVPRDVATSAMPDSASAAATSARRIKREAIGAAQRGA